MSSSSVQAELEASPANLSQAAVTAWAVHVPGLDDAIPGLSFPDSCSAERAHELLGKKGLLYKEPATLLALCAVHRALGLPAGPSRAQTAPDPRTSVVASSNLGNVATVEKIVTTLRTGAGKDVSPLDAPNASSNVIASTVAIWFRFGGPNLMVCSGSTSGLDAVAAAALLLRSGRADRVVVVGAEPDDRVATMLHARRAGTSHGRPLRAGAAAVVLEAVRRGPENAPRLGKVFAARDLDELAERISAPLVVGPPEAAPAVSRTIDVATCAGDSYGALGVLQVAVAAELLAGDGAPPTVAVVCGDHVDGWRAAELVRDRSDS